MNRILILCLLAVPAARAADEFKPVKAGEQVAYPLPPMPLPQVQAPPDGKWAETEDSPALRVSRAWVKLGQAAGIERSEATHKLYQAWKRERAQGGATSRAAEAAYARFLAAYKKDLERAKSIYEGVLRDLDNMEVDGTQTAGNGPDNAAGSLAKEAEEQIQSADRDDHLTNSACFLSPDTCQ